MTIIETIKSLFLLAALIMLLVEGTKLTIWLLKDLFTPMTEAERQREEAGY
jgi:hypothetical protein